MRRFGVKFLLLAAAAIAAAPDAEFVSEKSYWKGWEMTVRGKPRGAVRP